MGLLLLSTLTIALGICFVPAFLQRRRAFSRTQDFVIASPPATPGVIQNSSTAYALKLIIFGLFFGWGVNGDLWPALISAACYSLGWGLIFLLRQPIIEFINAALRSDRSVTVHEFIALQYGNDARVRLLSSSLTILALLAVLAAETMAVATMLTPLQFEGAAPVELFIAGALVLMAFYVMRSGNSAVMQSVQWQFGMMVLGLFGTTALLLYIHVSGLTPLPAHGLFAMLMAAGCSVFILYCRRSRYVDTNPVRLGDEPGSESTRKSSSARLLSRFGKILNPAISVFAALIVVLAVMGLHFAGLHAIERSSAAALQTGTRISNAGLPALILLPLFYPIADVTNWQRIAAAVQNEASTGNGSRLSLEAWRRLFAAGSLETPLLWLFAWALGALAMAAAEPTHGSGALRGLMEQLASEQNDGTAIVLPLLLLCVFSMALAAMSSIFSACLCTIRYDVLPGSRARHDPPGPQRHSFVLGGLLLIVPISVFILGGWSIGFTSRTFLHLALAFCCAQLSFVALVGGAVISRTQKTSATISPRWALAVLCTGAGGAAGALSGYLITGSEAWIWTAVPVCLGSGLVVLALGWLCSGKAGMRR